MTNETDKYYFDRWNGSANWAKIGNSKKKRFRNFIELYQNYIGEEHLSNIIDYGCGSGWFLIKLHEQGFSGLNGFDVTPSTLKVLKRDYPFIENIWGLKNETANDIPKRHFDLCISSEVYEHVPFGKKFDFLNNISAIIKDEGFLYITTPNGNYKKNAIKPNKYQPVEDWATPAELQRELKLAGFKILEMGSFYLSSNLSWIHKIIFSTKMSRLWKILKLKNRLEFYASKNMMGLSTYYLCKKIVKG